MVTTAVQDALVIASLPPAARLAQAAALNSAADALALAGLRHRHPHATPRDLGVALALQRLGCSRDSFLAERLRQETYVSDQPTDFLAVAARAARACTDLGIPYLIGGGVAATVHGEFRTTRDVDLVVRLKRADARRFAAALSGDFSLAPPMSWRRSTVLQSLPRIGKNAPRSSH